MKVVYIAHSGFCVELLRHVLLFDYFTGKLPEWDSGKELVVFASHRHQDHFNVKVLKLAEQYERVRFVLGSDVRLKEDWLEKKGIDPAVLSKASFIRPGTALYLPDGGESVRESDWEGEAAPFEGEKEGVCVRALRSTDEGVAFLVETEGKRFYHAGDLNWWHWEEEGKAWNRNMEVSYKKEIDRMAGQYVDVAFVPLDPRLGRAYGWGMEYFLQKVSAGHVFPMHMWEEYGYIGKYKEEHADADRMVTIHDRGEAFLIEGEACPPTAGA